MGDKMAVVRVRQYAYFGVFSDKLTADEITARVGLEPDEIAVRGSASTDPVRPAAHRWVVTSGLGRDRSMDDHVEVIVLRLWDVADRIRQIADGRSTSAVLQLVRHFDADEREDPEVASRGVPDAMERLTGQHPLLGFHLDERTVGFLQHVNASIDIDEYGDDDD